MKNRIIFTFLLITLAACTPVVEPVKTPAQPTLSALVAAVTTADALTQAARFPSPPPITAVTPSPLPTQLTIVPTLNPTQTVQQEEIKGVIQAYFDLRYQALSVSPPKDFQQSGFGNLVSDEPDARDFLVTEMAKLAVERKWIDLNKFGYAKYEYSLKYKDIFIDASAQTATVSLLEDFTIVTKRAMESNPEELSTIRGDLTHEIVLHNEQGQWKIISDTYWDSWWYRYRKPGMSTDEILREINTHLQKLEAMPSATPWPSPTP
ncbi:MAG: hypothetical protein ACOYYU_04950 [Chloroflexota bacterium]